MTKAPNLSELIESCSKTHPSKPDYEFVLVWSLDTWCAGYMNRDMNTTIPVSTGASPEEAVARLWLALKNI